MCVASPETFSVSISKRSNPTLDRSAPGRALSRRALSGIAIIDPCEQRWAIRVLTLVDHVSAAQTGRMVRVSSGRGQEGPLRRKRAATTARSSLITVLEGGAVLVVASQRLRARSSVSEDNAGTRVLKLALRTGSSNATPLSASTPRSPLDTRGQRLPRTQTNAGGRAHDRTVDAPHKQQAESRS